MTPVLQIVERSLHHATETVRSPMTPDDAIGLERLRQFAERKLTRSFPPSIAREAAHLGWVATVMNWENVESPNAFLRAAAHNAAVDALRKQAARNEVPMDTQDIEFLMEPDQPELQVELEDLLDRELPPLTARFARLLMQGAGVRQAARELGILPARIPLLKQQIRTVLELALDESEAPPSSVDLTEATVLLRRMVPELTPRQREALALLLRGRKPAVIAKEMGIDANNVRVTLSHARKRIGRLLNWSPEEVALTIEMCQQEADAGRAPAA